MCKKYIKLLTNILIVGFIFFLKPLFAVQGYINHGGFVYNQSVIVNWNVFAEPSDNRAKINKISYKDLNFSVKQPIIIDSSTVPSKTNNYVIIQDIVDKNNNKSLIQNQKLVNKEISKSRPKTKDVMKKKLIAMEQQKEYLPTKNVIVSEPRFIEDKKNKKVELATIKMVPVDLENNKKTFEKNIKKEKEIRIKIENLFANVDNPFDDTFDSPVDTETFTKPGVKKTKAPSYNPLTRYPLSQYTVKGVITSNQGNRALVTTDQGNYFYIKEGQFIGVNKGIVDTINDNSIIILQKDRRIEIIVSSDGRISRK